MCVVLIPYNWQYDEMLVACEKRKWRFDKYGFVAVQWTTIKGTMYDDLACFIDHLRYESLSVYNCHIWGQVNYHWFQHVRDYTISWLDELNIFTTVAFMIP